MAPLNVDGSCTPTRPISAAEIDLDYVSKRLCEPVAPRNDIVIPATPEPHSGPPTPPPPNALHPLEYYRAESELRLAVLNHGRLTQSDPCATIEDPRYYIIQTEFFSQNVVDYEDRRQKIEDSYYWRCEANHYRSQGGSGASIDRFLIFDCVYWKIELEYMVPKSRLPEHQKIAVVEYWQIRLRHFAKLSDARDLDSQEEDAAVSQGPPTPALTFSPPNVRQALKRKRSVLEASVSPTGTSNASENPNTSDWSRDAAVKKMKSANNAQLSQDTRLSRRVSTTAPVSGCGTNLTGVSTLRPQRLRRSTRGSARGERLQNLEAG